MANLPSHSLVLSIFILLFCSVQCIVPQHVTLSPVSHQIQTTTLENIIRETNAFSLNSTERQHIISQAIILIRDLSPNTFIQRKTFKVNAVRRLQKFRRIANTVSTYQFHMTMRSIHHSMNDKHARYFSGGPLMFARATLGFRIRQYYASAGSRAPRYVIASLDSDLPLLNHPILKIGTRIVAINNQKIENYIQKVGKFEASPNLASLIRAGTNLATRRRFFVNPPPQRQIYTIKCVINGRLRTVNIRWMYYFRGVPTSSRSSSLPSSFKFTTNLQSDVTLYSLESKDFSGEEDLEPSTPTVRTSIHQEDPNVIEVPPILQQSFNARLQPTNNGTYGYLRISDFYTQLSFESLFNLSSLLEKFPKEGIIIDIRGNVGGSLLWVRLIAELLSPRMWAGDTSILKATKLLMRMASDPDVSFNRGYVIKLHQAGLESAVKYGNPFTAPSGEIFYQSEAIPGRLLNQSYFGPVVLLTNAATTSVGDSMAAIFKDFGFAHVICADQNTAGAGSSNVQYEYLNAEFKKYFPKPLPKGVSLGTGVSAGSRFLNNAGKLIEPEGVEGNERYYYTLKDVLPDTISEGIYNRAGTVLKGLMSN